MIVADSSSIISLALNCMSCVFKELGVEVTITPEVYDEIITKPAKSRKYALEALRIKKLAGDGIISTVTADTALTEKLLDISNSIFEVKGKPLKIIHRGEAEAVVLVKSLNADALLIDERTTRLLIEDPTELMNFLSGRSREKIRLNKLRLNELSALIPKVPIIRSTEVAAVAYESGVLEKMLGSKGVRVLDACLSALKYSGCAVTWGEIDEYKRIMD